MREKSVIGRRAVSMSVVCFSTILLFTGQAQAANSNAMINSDFILETGESVSVSGAAFQVGIGTGTGSYTITVNGDSSIQAVSNNHIASGVYFDNPSTSSQIIFNSNNPNNILTISAIGATDAYGIYNGNNSIGKLEFNVATKVSAEGSGDGKEAVGVWQYGGGNITFNNSVEINSLSHVTGTAYNAATGVRVTDRGSVNFNDTARITVSADNVVNTYGVLTEYNAKVKFAKATEINVTGQQSIGVDKDLMGVVSILDGSQIVFADAATINVANNSNGTAFGAFAYEPGSGVSFAGDTAITVTGAGDNVAIYTAGGNINLSKATTNIDTVNSIDANQIKITGDVISETGNINISMKGASSFVNGNVASTSGDQVNLGLHDSATWLNRGVSNVSYLNSSNGIIKQGSTNNDSIVLEKFAGNATIEYQNTVSDGIMNVLGGNISIDSVVGNAVLNIVAANSDKVNTLDKAKAQDSLNNLVSKLVYSAGDNKLSGTATIKEGLITPWASGAIEYGADGTGTVVVQTGGSTSTMEAMKNIAAVNIISWRQENNSLNKRMGELRDTDAVAGMWARMSRGEFEYNDAYKNQYNFMQIGYDKGLGAWHYGVGLSYNDAKTSYVQGKGDNNSISLATYGTWLANSGHYADIVLKVGRLYNSYDNYVEAGHTHGSYNTWGLSISGEYGRQIDLKNNWYITPQVQLNLMNIAQADYTTNNGILVNQDALTSFTGRIGAEFGKKISNRGRIFTKLSFMHEFAGTANSQLSLQDIKNSYRQSIGGNWLEASIGFNYRTSSKTHVYADVGKVWGSSINTPWQWSAGMRLDF